MKKKYVLCLGNLLIASSFAVVCIAFGCGFMHAPDVKYFDLFIKILIFASSVIFAILVFGSIIARPYLYQYKDSGNDPEKFRTDLNKIGGIPLKLLGFFLIISIVGTFILVISFGEIGRAHV